MTQPMVISYLRFSHPDQIRGDSMRRQLDLGDRWAKANGVVISDSFRDLGISAFRGANATEGNLSRFMKMVDAGSVPPGSTLLIEQLDRLSRNALLDALELFLSIIRRGITIVTLMDGQRYDRESLSRNMMQLQYSIMMMSLAHEESAKKSERLGHAWKAKRERLDQKVYTRRLPAWMKAEGDRIVLDDAKAAIVKHIIDQTLAGHGIGSLTKTLNATTAPIGRAKHWNRSFVCKVLHSRALIGEFEPHKLAYKNGRKSRESLGKTIKGYYPALIDDQTFYALQKKMTDRRQTGGPTTKYVNLFNGVLFDARDGTALALQDKGAGKRYASMAAIQGQPGHSPYVGFPVAIFEQGFLLNFHDYVLPRVFQADDGSAQQELDATDAKLAEADRKAAKLNDAMLAAGEDFDATIFAASMTKLAKQRQALADQHEAARRRLAAEEVERRNTLDERLIKLVRMVKAGTDTLSHDQRIQLREAIRSSISRIDATTTRDGRDYWCAVTVKLRDGQTFAADIIAHFHDQMARDTMGHPIKSDRPAGPQFKLGLGEPRWLAFGSADGASTLVAKTDEPISHAVPTA